MQGCGNQLQQMPKINITKDMCKLMGFEIDERYHETSNYDWIAERGMLKIHALDDEISVILRFGGSAVHLEHIKYVHQVQKLYELLHNEVI